ncbi:MAG TPA: nucleoside 2-deoxyribosyltransferase [Candidatus Nitrosopolaris sp.]|nr:nucleoside 2-deoxyribosyltransferase [Candidatus Nitrosopolaris sp.]
MVCGSIGYGGIDDVRRFYTLLATEGFEIVDHIVGKEMDYSDIKDFRNKKELSHQIVNHDLEYVKKADVLIVLASPPSYGAAIEMFVAKNSGKKIILLAKDPVPTPWSINFSDYVVTTEEALIKLLWNLKSHVSL